MMTKKHMVQFAAMFQAARADLIVSEGRHADGMWTAEEVAAFFQARVAAILAADNPRFDRGRFDTACVPKFQQG